MKKKKSLLLLRPRLDIPGAEGPYFGYFLLSAVLEKSCNLEIIDCNSTYSIYSDEYIADRIRRMQPEVIGLTLFISYVNSCYRLISSLRELRRRERMDFTIAVGGPHATILPEEVLDHGADIVVRGEGERTLLAVIGAAPEKRAIRSIEGISYKEENRYVHNRDGMIIEDLDSLPFQSREYYKGFFEKEESLSRYNLLLTSRGCPGQCTFCAGGILGRKMRFRSPESVVEEMMFLRKIYDAAHVKIMDDTFTVNKRRILEICDLKKRNSMLKELTWECGTRINCVDMDLLGEMKSAGCTQITYGVESGNRETLRRIGKDLAPELIEEVIRKTYEAKIPVCVNFMLGYPFESIDDIRNTRKFINRIMPFIRRVNNGGVLVPLPGTKLYEEYKNTYDFERWWLKEEFSLSHYRKPFYNFTNYWEESNLRLDFFKYSSEVKQEIIHQINIIAEFNFRNVAKTKRGILIFFNKISLSLFNKSPKLENALFLVPVFFIKAVRRIRSFFLTRDVLPTNGR